MEHKFLENVSKIVEVSSSPGWNRMLQIFVSFEPFYRYHSLLWTNLREEIVKNSVP